MVSESLDSRSKARTLVLQNKKVYLRPIIRAGGMFPEGHDGAFMFTGTVLRFVLPYDIRNHKYPNIFAPGEQEAFEELLGLDLNPYKKENNFWHKFEIKIIKDDTLMRFGYRLDLSDPMDALRYRMAKFIPQIAPSWEERNESAEYRLAIVDEDSLEKTQSAKVDLRKEAYIYLGKIENNPRKMADLLRVYGITPPKDASPEWLKNQIDNIISDSRKLPSIVGIIKDQNYETRLLIEDAIDAGVIIKENRKYYLNGGDPINPTDSSLEGTIKELNKLKAETDDRYLRIVSEVQKYNETK